MTNEPFAYAAVAMDASESTYVTTSREQAEAACREYGWQLVPLYAGPTFTAAEREAVEWFAEVRKPLDSLDGGAYVAVLRALRERIGREVFDMSCAANAPKQERTSATHATPAQGSVAGPVKRQVFLRKNMTNDAPPTWQEEVAAVEDAFERSGVNPTWPDDEPGNIGPMAAAMADEIGRLRLTHAERSAVKSVVRLLYSTDYDVEYSTLRGLLERMK